MPGIDDELDVLFVVTPEEFTATRDALVKQLRAEKQRDRAAEVAKMRRPTPAVWALNQTARTQPDTLSSLRAAGRSAEAAQAELLNGGPLEAFNAAVQQRRELTTALVTAALQLLRKRGVVADSVVRDLRSALELASLDQAGGELLSTGRLEVLPTLAMSMFEQSKPAGSTESLVGLATTEHSATQQSGTEQSETEQSGTEPDGATATAGAFPALRLVPPYRDNDDQEGKSDLDQLAGEQLAREDRQREQAAKEAAEKLRLQKEAADSHRLLAAQNLQLAEQHLQQAEQDVQGRSVDAAVVQQRYGDAANEVASIRHQIEDLQAKLAVVELFRDEQERQYESALGDLETAETARQKIEFLRNTARQLFKEAEAAAATVGVAMPVSSTSDDESPNP